MDLILSAKVAYCCVAVLTLAFIKIIAMIFVTKLSILSHNAQDTSGMPKYALCSI